jgi:hypothetical protein
MGEFSKTQGVMHFALRSLLNAGQSYPGGLGTWINLERDWLQLTLFEGARFQPDGKRDKAMHYGALAGEQQPCTSL